MNLREVWKAANEMIEMFGEDAAVRAAMRSDAELDVGEVEQSRFWRRGVVSIEGFGGAKREGEVAQKSGGEICRRPAAFSCV
jgi:hypothetical protein